MTKTTFFLPMILLLLLPISIFGQEADSLLTLDRIYASGEFRGEYQRPISWIEGGDAYVTIERNKEGQDELVRYASKTNRRSLFLSASQLTPQGDTIPISVENFGLSSDGTKVLVFTNSERVWRSRTKGDYWVYDLETGKLKQLGKNFPASSLMFAKFAGDNEEVAYVQEFNIYIENFETGEIKQLTNDGNGDIINGTFDWVYEEEFGARDGFSWSPDASKIAFWQMDASEIGTFYMINNTDSVYSNPIPLQYPKVGYDPSSAKIGLINTRTTSVDWIPVPGDPGQHYLPAMQWIDEDLLLIQQLNRKQNELNIYTYKPSDGELKKVYTEQEETWVDLRYPDISSNQWGNNEQLIVDDGKSFLRMTEGDGWRHIYKVNLKSGEKTLLTPGNFDVAAYYQTDEKNLYLVASPDNATQRYLYRVPLNGSGKLTRVTPLDYEGVNTYDLAPNGKYAIHNFTNTSTPRTTRLISLPGHRTIKLLIDNLSLKEQLAGIHVPETSFFKVTTEEGIQLDGRMTKPLNFDSSKEYPVLFKVYGEPWGVVATDTWIGLYEIFMAQQGFVVISMDNRGTPSLKGSAWRKSIYQQVGVLNTRDQALAAKRLLESHDYLDESRVNVWGWSGGGSMTQNLLFRYPEIYHTGVAVAGVANQFLYNNVYQERYMGLSGEDREIYLEGSPVTYAKNLEGNLLLIHGTGDDNVHYQNMEVLVNELIKHNKQFEMMSYPNRSHSISEGENTTRHLYTLITNYFLRHNGLK